MKSNKDILGSVLKTAQMGQTGIRAVESYASKQELKDALNSQKAEYHLIEQEAYRLAAMRGWELPSIHPMTKTMSQMCARGNLMFGHPDSKIAAMMINGNTRGMIKGLKNLHHRSGNDHAVVSLSEKLVDCEIDNIRQMQGYV